MLLNLVASNNTKLNLACADQVSVTTTMDQNSSEVGDSWDHLQIVLRKIKSV